MTPPGNALNFEGANGYVSLANEGNFDFTNAMTVAAWIKVNSFTHDWQAIVTKGDGSWRLQRYSNTNFIDFGTAGLSNGDLEGTTNVNDGKWHYVAGVFDGSKKYLYVDGSLDASVSVTGTISTNNQEVEIGANSDWSSQRNFDGLIDEVRIWNVARTQTQIQDNMNTVLVGNETGLVAYYKFDMSSGTWLYDHTGHNNSGRLHNMVNSDWVASGWTVNHTNTWTGNVGNDWNTAGNWNDNTVPGAADNVLIPQTTRQPVVQPGEEAECHNLIIDNGASLTIASDATGNGSLILHGSEKGNVTVQRYIPGYTSASNGWHEVSVPFDGTVPGTNFEPGTNDDLYSWNETAYQWDNYKIHNFNFVRGKGYLASYKNTGVHAMTGTLSGNGITLNNLSCTSDKGNGWHLLGNPFTSAITWNNNNGGWALNNLGALAEIYTEAAGNYSVLSRGSIIPSTNGFFVQVVNAVNSITIPAAARTFASNHNNNKSALASPADSCLKLKVTGEANSYYDVTEVCFCTSATDGWDQNYDARKLFGAQTAPQLWTVSVNENFAWNTLPPPGSNFSLPLDFQAGVNSTYHLTWSGIKNIPSNWQVLLKDTQTNTSVNMRKISEYDFKATTTDDPGRFVLHINGTTGIPSVVGNNGLSVYSLRKDIYLKTKGNETLKGKVQLYNLWGQPVYQARLNGTNQQTLNTELSPGIYVVRVKSKGQVLLAKKILIR
jgi:hypothetical protein